MKALNPTHRTLYLAVIVLWATYATLTLMAPLAPGSARFHLDTLELQVIRLTVIIPMLATWILAAYGAIRFKSYANSIRASADGKAMKFIATGLGWLAGYLIILTMIGAILPYLYQSEYRDFMISCRNIITMLSALIGFIYIYIGAQKLSRLINSKPIWNSTRVWKLLVPYCLFAIAFTYAFFINPDIAQPGQSLSVPTYVLPPAILLVVIVIPYLSMWLLGILAILNIRAYAFTVPGVIYKKILSRLVRGVLGVMSFTIALQIFNVLLGTISQLTLGRILLIIYLLIILVAVSYASIASGARRLAKIEGVS
jgi:hypothetical protein